MNYKEQTVHLGDKEYIIQSYSPVFADENENKTAMKAVEQNLFDIFIKYMG